MVRALIGAVLACSLRCFPQEAAWNQKFPEQIPPGRSFHAMAYDAAHQEVILFGGVDAAGSFLGDTWAWDGSQWSQRSLGSGGPSARHRHAMAYDSARGQIVLFGGVDEKNGILSETWVWDGKSWAQKITDASPQARFGHAMAYDTARRQIVLFGGQGTSGMFSDTWTWDGTTWAQQLTANKPGPRAFHAMAFGLTSAKVVLFGGVSPDGLASDETWIWDGADWTQKSPANHPMARAWSAAAPDPTGSVILFGGTNPMMTGVPFEDSWIWDGTNWMQAGTTASIPARMFHAMAYDVARRQSVLFSGIGHSSNADDLRGNVLQGVVLNDTWIWNITTILAAPSITPPGAVPVDSTINTIQPGEWVSIYGTNLASSTVTGDGNFPTSLGGTSVTINGKAGYLSFVSPSQINLQAPNDTAIGPVPVVVTTASGTAATTVTLAQFGASLLLLDGKHVAGIILRSNGSGAYGGGTYDIIGPTGDSLGYATVAAKAGDAIELFAVGLGPTNPAVPAGQVFAGTASTTNPVMLRMNDVSVTPAFAGLSGAGLYQLNLIVPSGIGTGDVSLQVTVGGVQTPSGVVIPLQ